MPPPGSPSAADAIDPARDAALLFSAVLEKMAGRMSLFSYRGFIEPLVPLRIESGPTADQLVLAAPTAFHRDWARDHYATELAREATTLVGRAVHVLVQLIDGVAKPAAPSHAQQTAAHAQHFADDPSFHGDGTGSVDDIAPPASAPQGEGRVVELRARASSGRGALSSGSGGMRLNPKYSLDAYVTGPSNRIAYAACSAVAENPASRYTPLFLFGGTGLGKTHLLQAIGNEVLERHPHLRVVYMSAEQWVNEYIHEIREKRFDEFRRRYREGCDVLLLDDIQFLAGKDSSQDEFFHTFNSLYEAHKQIVVTSDRYPHEIAGLEERLKTRLQWGLIADVQPPDLETRLAILQQKSMSLGIALPVEVADYLASHVTSSVRELEGALVRLHAFSAITREPLSLSIAREHLRPVLQQKGQQVTIARVVEVVATYYGLKPLDLKGPSRMRQVTRARQIAMHVARTHLQASLPEIGRAFGGRDHTTVLASVRKIEALKASDAGVQATLSRLVQSLFGV